MAAIEKKTESEISSQEAVMVAVLNIHRRSFPISRFFSRLEQTFLRSFFTLKKNIDTMSIRSLGEKKSRAVEFKLFLNQFQSFATF